MAKGKERDRRKEQLWQRWIQQWRSNGRSVRAFCEQNGLAAPSFYAWRRELKRRQEQTSTFVPVEVLRRDEPPRGAIELVLAGQRVVRVPPGFDAATLRQVLAALAEGGAC